MFSKVIKYPMLKNITKKLARNENGVIGVKNNLTSNEVNNTECFANTATSVKTSVAESKNKSSDYFNVLYKKSTRAPSTSTSVPIAASKTRASTDENREFMSVFPELMRVLTEQTKKHESKEIAENVPNDASKWFAKVLQYNVPTGKLNRGLTTVFAFKTLAKPEDLTPENLTLVQYLGWFVEMSQAAALIADDIMDGGEKRRGAPCWYKVENVKMIAVNDVLMIEKGVFILLKKYFSHTPYYVKLIELFQETLFVSLIGQSLDLQAPIQGIDAFTMERYKAIVSNKTSYYTFYLPVALAMHMTGYTDPEIFRQTKTLLLEMGYFYQVQDDFLDCFGDPAITGKIGNDIVDGKCTWLSVVCMQRASKEQKQIMRDNYGKLDPICFDRIRKLYTELGLPNTYAVYEEESYNMIITHIQQTSRGVPHNIFFKMIQEIYRRER